MSLETKSLSPTLSNLIAEINYSIDSVKEKILAAYTYAIDKDGFTPKEAAKLLRDKLEYSDSYIRRVLPLESKETKFANKPNNDGNEAIQKSPTAVNITTAYDIKEAETEEEPQKPSSALEEFRETKGVKEQSARIPNIDPELEVTMIEDEPDEIYDKTFVDRLIKENAQLVNSFSFDYDLEVKDQILPLKVTCYPDKKTGYVRLDKGRIKK